jgi:cytochrome c oxidase cbb3-type subunit III
MAEPRDQLTGHDYDGIQEYDNPTPGWWHVLFLASIVFSLFYLLFWHGSPLAWTIHDAHAAAEMREIKRQFAEIGTLEHNEATMLRMMNEPRWLSVGESIFRGNCASCHGARGQGEVGSNLTDDNWIHIRNLAGILDVVSDGANRGAMPGWKTRLHPNEVVLVSAYVATLRGRNESGRRAEGEVIPPWPTLQK